MFDNALTTALITGGVLGTAAAGVVAQRAWRSARAQGLDRWACTALQRQPWSVPTRVPDEPLEVFIAICDHYEPEWGNANPDDAMARVNQWRRDYPRLFGSFADVNGRPPQHTFFYPQDQYRPQYLDGLRDLVTAGLGDVDVHLHHDNDTPDGLREKLETFRRDLYYQHGLLRLDPANGEIVYGFIHGNWALNNSRRDGRWCGVDHEIPILLETGCYADFTFPSAPSDTQPRIINRIYHAQDCPGCRASHERGVMAEVGKTPPPDSLLMIQGPLGFDFGRRKWGMIPKIENGDLLDSHPPQIRRLPLWLQAGVTVAGKPNWRFVKLHTHGCKPSNMSMWLSDTVQQFHADLARTHREQPQFRYHYVTAWEMAQLVRQAEQETDGGLPLSMRTGVQPALT